MKHLDGSETSMVAGGGSGADAAARALEMCNMYNLPDSTKIKISVTESTGLGASAVRISRDASAKVETTCGELRENSPT